MKPTTEKKEPRVLFYVRELKSDGCQCGRPKQPGKSLCWECWKQLPRNIQQDLYLPICNGYEQAYDEAVEFLSE